MNRDAGPILVLAPFPFFQERGTPIAVDLLLKTLSRRGETVHLVTFPEGEDRDYAGLSLHRACAVPGVKGVRPGFSWKKVVLDVALSLLAARVARRVRPRVIHAVEESVFPALVIGRWIGCPVIYDMDSLLSDQLASGRWYWRPLRGLFAALERMAMRRSAAVAPMCDALADHARAAGQERVVVLRDIALMPKPPPPYEPRTKDCCRMVYVGNLEAYQGIGLLLEALALAAEQWGSLRLETVGGTEAHREQYRRQARDLGIQDRVTFHPPRPLADLAEVLGDADILVSPRVEGENTPMKIYSYMAAGRAILATDLATHTQVLDESCAVLSDPDPQSLAAGILRLAHDAPLRQRLGQAAARRAAQRHSPEAFQRAVDELYRPWSPPAADGGEA